MARIRFNIIIFNHKVIYKCALEASALLPQTPPAGITDPSNPSGPYDP
jgi:hypothetical protein